MASTPTQGVGADLARPVPVTMSIARKLILALAALAAVALVLEAVVDVESDYARSLDDAKADHRALGRLMRELVREEFRATGVVSVPELRTVAGSESIELSFLWREEVPERLQPDVADLPPEGRSLVRTAETPPRLVTFVPVTLGERQGVVKISELLDARYEAPKSTALRIGATALFLALGFLVLAAFLGRRLIGAPVAQLVALSRRLQAGELAARVELHARDELGVLGGAMNEMAAALGEARERLARETAARLAVIEHLRHVDRLGTVGTLAAGVAHELGTPLNVVAGHASMLEKGEVQGAEVASSAHVIADQVTTMTRIIRQLLDFARRRKPERALVALRPLLESSLSLLRPLAQKRAVELKLDAHDVQAHVDAGQVQQVVTNLVLNAIQASQGPATVTVGARRELVTPPPELGGPARAFARIDVTDQGGGIPAELRPHIFEPFFTTKGVGEGTGLGLSVSWGLVVEHQGWIDVESEEGKGSTFRVFLPAEGG